MSAASPGNIHYTLAGSEHGSLLSGLFERSDVACHCRFWHFSGTNNDWLLRLAQDADTNRREMLDALESRTGEMQGIVAIHGENGLERDETSAVGWMKLAPVEAVAKLYGQRVYRNLPIFRARQGVVAIGCFLVDPAVRHRGVARGLLAAGVAWARENGVRAVEAFPRGAAELRDEEALAGPLALFTEQGFAVVHDFAPYPVLRLDLA
jgi:GNAT superfamily N-acetyltransferase